MGKERRKKSNKKKRKKKKKKRCACRATENSDFEAQSLQVG
jgi:hypothetical protein